jgi:hypothetical protein
MKNSILKVASIIAITATLLTGCSLSSDNSNDSNGFVADPNNFKGTISGETITLNPTLIYKLTGKLQINDGASLTIPAGTVIEGVGGTAAYIAVAQGGKLFVAWNSFKSCYYDKWISY